MRVASCAQGSRGAATISVSMAALSTTFGPALLMRVKNFSLCGCIRRPIGDPPGPTISPYVAQHRFAQSLSVHSGQHGNEEYTPSFTLIHSAPRGLRQALGRAL